MEEKKIKDKNLFFANEINYFYPQQYKEFKKI